MGNKNTSSHVSKSNGHDYSRYLSQQNSINHEDIENNFQTASYGNSNGKKHGPSPRFRRRQSKQGKKSQVTFRKPSTSSFGLTFLLFCSRLLPFSMLVFNPLVIERQVYFLEV